MIALKPTSSTDILSLLSPISLGDSAAHMDSNFLSLFNNLLDQSQEGKQDESDLSDFLAEQPLLPVQQALQSETLNYSLSISNTIPKSLNNRSSGQVDLDKNGEPLREVIGAKESSALIVDKVVANPNEVTEISRESVQNKGVAASQLAPRGRDTVESEFQSVEVKVTEQKHSVLTEVNTTTGKVVIEQNTTLNKFVSSDLKSMTETIKAEVSNFQTSDLSSGSITIKIKPSNLGEIVIVMEKDSTVPASKFFDKSTGAPIDIRLVASNPEVRNYLNLIKREVASVVGIRTINVSNHVLSIKSSEKSSSSFKDSDFIDQIFEN